MRYILNDSGFIETISFTYEIECNNKTCTEYTGTVPTGYESLSEWSENANINAYKIVEGNLTYDSEEDARLQSLWASQEVSSGSSLNEVINLLFPVGKVEIFFDDEDHSNYLGFTWERTSIGRFPIGIGTNTDLNNDTRTLTIGQKGGEYEHKLTIDEIPSHKHNGIDWWGQDNMPLSLNNGTTYPEGYVLQWAKGTMEADSLQTSSAGGEQPHNNIPPYEAMAFWKRIS